jgi:pyruvate/2-oxoglutarate dehydrogenase complex dihydrolipoamide acyltransferase (E2) component
VRLEARGSIIGPPKLAFVSRPRKGSAILTNLLVPKTGGMNTTKVNVVRWLKQEGDALQRGEPVVELETEKVNYELDSPVEGVLLKIVSREPAEVPVGGLLAYIGKPGDAVPGA